MKPLAALQDILLFVEVADHLSFSAASRTLGMPVATLSRRIAALEQLLGVHLLKRSTRRVELTEAGRQHHDRCAQLVRDARDAHDALFEAVHDTKGLVRLAMPVDLGVHLVGPILAEFARQHPDIRLDIDLSPHPPASAAAVDLSIQIGPVSGDAQAVARRIGQLEMHLYAAPAYVRAHGLPAVPGELSQHDCIVRRSATRPSFWQLRRGRRVVSVPVQGRFLCNSQGMVRSLVTQGLGIGLLVPGFVPGEQLARLVRVLPEWSLPHLPLFAVMSSRLAPKRVRLLLEFIADGLASAAPSLARKT